MTVETNIQGYEIAQAHQDALERIWGGMRGKIAIVVASVSDYERLGGGAAVPEGDAYGLSVILHVLGNLYSYLDLSVYLSAHIPDGIENKNLVLIGGPVTNSLTQKVLSHRAVKDGLMFTFDAFKIVNQQTGEVFEANIRNGDVTGGIESPGLMDYGFAWKGGNPLSQDKRAYVLAGSRTFGTLAAVSALTVGPCVDNVALKFGNEGFELLVERSCVLNVDHDQVQVLYPKGLTIFPTAAVGQIYMNSQVWQHASSRGTSRLRFEDVVISCGLLFGGLLAIFVGALKGSAYLWAPGFVGMLVGIWHLLVQRRRD